MTATQKSVGSWVLTSFLKQIHVRISKGELKHGSIIDIKSIEHILDDELDQLLHRLVDQHYIGAALPSQGVAHSYAFTLGRDGLLRLKYPFYLTRWTPRWLTVRWTRHFDELKHRAWQELNAAKAAMLLVKDAGLLVFVDNVESRWVKIDREISFGGLSKEAILKLIRHELERQVADYSFDISQTDDPAVFKVKITNVHFIHNHPVASS